ncbi:3-isopropylmalate dehydratase small subunit [Pandoraea oxalativorans]|uniref:3-isopropylmalate dehydratase small subunit n=1 Tax=Pandoraea oxalativorans TaxID=573737 RepID=A0A0E3YBB7_9BURK|nr:3-isopropylmalate dehydratase small subunit [Pandoraea oxalativorans]AKC69136.1 3-isopropylmalate dehydratase small subunit [Pandoraea oxalativorans]
MEPFVRHTGTVVPLIRDNVDTDAIIPKQFMKSIERTGFGAHLFDAWRYRDEGYYGKPASERVVNTEFVLNEPAYADGSILLTGRNFGCGSSREHAPWALFQYGFRVLIAVSFADIFFNNCCKNGLLPIALPEDVISELAGYASEKRGSSLTVDLDSRLVLLPCGRTFEFYIPDSQRHALLEGLDEVGATLLHSPEIREFERRRMEMCPWL